MATIYHDHNRADLLKGLLEANRERFMKRVSPRARRRFLYRLVEAYSMAGDRPQALEWARKVYEICEAEKDEISGVVSLRQMANVLHEQKNPRRISAGYENIGTTRAQFSRHDREMTG